MTCPICDKKTDQKYRPFCSRRCADLDLGNWLDDRYRAPGDTTADAQTQAGQAETPDPRLH